MILILHRRQYNISCIMRPSRHVSSTEPNTVSSTEPNTVSSTEPNTVINTHLRKASNILTPYQHKESYDI